MGGFESRGVSVLRHARAGRRSGILFRCGSSTRRRRIARDRRPRAAARGQVAARDDRTLSRRGGATGRCARVVEPSVFPFYNLTTPRLPHDASQARGRNISARACTARECTRSPPKCDTGPNSTTRSTARRSFAVLTVVVHVVVALPRLLDNLLHPDSVLPPILLVEPRRLRVGGRGRVRIA